MKGILFAARGESDTAQNRLELRGLENFELFVSGKLVAAS